MNEEKQIEEMAKAIYETGMTEGMTVAKIIAGELFHFGGYRKQSEGEWHTVVDSKTYIVTECSACKKQFWFMKKGQLNIDRMPYCPHCGAKTKGGAE